jgi:hypothetical protein
VQAVDIEVVRILKMRGIGIVSHSWLNGPTSDVMDVLDKVPTTD